MNGWSGADKSFQGRIVVMDTLAGLNNLIGQRGLLPVLCGAECFEVDFRFLSVTPLEGLPTETDEYAFHDAITRSRFTVCFDQGTLIDGSDTRVISGRHISRIRRIV